MARSHARTGLTQRTLRYYEGPRGCSSTARTDGRPDAPYEDAERARTGLYRIRLQRVPRDPGGPRSPPDRRRPAGRRPPAPSPHLVARALADRSGSASGSAPWRRGCSGAPTRPAPTSRPARRLGDEPVAVRRLTLLSTATSRRCCGGWSTCSVSRGVHSNGREGRPRRGLVGDGAIWMHQESPSTGWPARPRPARLPLRRDRCGRRRAHLPVRRPAPRSPTSRGTCPTASRVRCPGPEGGRSFMQPIESTGRR